MVDETLAEMAERQGRTMSRLIALPHQQADNQGFFKRNQDAIGAYHRPLVGTHERGSPAIVISDSCEHLGGSENAAPWARCANTGLSGITLAAGARLSVNQGSGRIRTLTNGDWTRDFVGHTTPFL